jgi:hypothetical protein
VIETTVFCGWCDEAVGVAEGMAADEARDVVTSRGWLCDELGEWCPECKHQDKAARALKGAF